MAVRIHAHGQTVKLTAKHAMPNVIKIPASTYKTIFHRFFFIFYNNLNVFKFSENLFL